MTQRLSPARTTYERSRGDASGRRGEGTAAGALVGAEGEGVGAVVVVVVEAVGTDAGVVGEVVVEILDAGVRITGISSGEAGSVGPESDNVVRRPPAPTCSV